MVILLEWFARDFRSLEAASSGVGYPFQVSSATPLRNIPRRSISTSTISPGFNQSGGVRREPTPPGVPVAITSPGSRRVTFLEGSGSSTELEPGLEDAPKVAHAQGNLSVLPRKTRLHALEI
jgi:hypothetical protein